MLSTIKESDLGVQHSGSKKDVLSGEMGQELSNITLASINLGSVHKRRRQLEREGSKIGLHCRIALENCRHGEGIVKNPEKLPTSFMNGLQ